MRIIIDAYNVIKASNATRDMYNTPESFVVSMKRYAKKRGHTLQVVFDGGVSSWPMREQYELVEVIFAGAGQTADAYIKQLLDAIPKGGAVLVSSDSELAAYAYQYDIVVVSALEFYHYVCSAFNINQRLVSNANNIVCLHNDSSYEYEELMRGAPVAIKQEDQVYEVQTKKSSRLNKKERKKELVLKKM